MLVERIDLHGMTVIESKVALNHLLDNIGYDCQEILVVHGYHSQILMNFLRNEYRHKRIKQVIISMNPGDTTFLLKTRQEMKEGKKGS